MGIEVEFHLELALASIKRYRSKKANLEECVPDNLKPGEVYNFLRRGQGIYWMEDEIPLVEISHNGELSKPLASITILEETHFRKNNQIYIRGKYKIVEVFTVNDNLIHFEGMRRSK